MAGIFLQASITFRSGYPLFHRLQELCELCCALCSLCSAFLHIFLPLSVCLLVVASHCTWLQPGDHTLQLSEFGQSTWSVRCTDIFVALHFALGSNSQEGSSQIFLATISYNPLEHSAPEAAFIPRTEDSAVRSGFRFQNYRKKKHKPPQMHLIHFETISFILQPNALSQYMTQVQRSGYASK